MLPLPLSGMCSPFKKELCVKSHPQLEPPGMFWVTMQRKSNQIKIKVNNYNSSTHTSQTRPNHVNHCRWVFTTLCRHMPLIHTTRTSFIHPPLSVPLSVSFNSSICLCASLLLKRIWFPWRPQGYTEPQREGKERGRRGKEKEKGERKG